MRTHGVAFSAGNGHGLLLSLLLLALALCPTALQAQFTPAEYSDRRASVAAMLPDGAVLLVLGAPEPAHDYLDFHQHPAMLYLAGIREPGSALLLARRGSSPVATVFVRPRDPLTEVWSGARIGPAGAARASGAAGRSIAELDAVTDSLAAAGVLIVAAGDVTAAGARPGSGVQSPGDQYLARVLGQRPRARLQFTGNEVVERARSRKSPAELALIRRAVEITNEAHRDAMRSARPGIHEYELEAVIEFAFRRNGAERPAFASIVGSGPNATTLHYNVNDRQTRPGELVVMDVGASYRGYAADVTRTIPVDGVFTPAQRDIYQIVRDAQAAAERNALPGMRSRVMLDSAMAVIAAGLGRLGLIESPGATYDVVGPDGSRRQARQASLYFNHGLGHGIGLEVHDPEQFYYTGVVAEGSAFTIEPGIYVRETMLDQLADTPRNRAFIAAVRTAFDRYRNIGVRIEDDYVVTASGLEWLSRAPREIAEIEALMRRPSP
jgi:Xaa-Pro aminopeptidase